MKFLVDEEKYMHYIRMFFIMWCDVITQNESELANILDFFRYRIIALNLLCIVLFWWAVSWILIGFSTKCNTKNETYSEIEK